MGLLWYNINNAINRNLKEKVDMKMDYGHSDWLKAVKEVSISDYAQRIGYTVQHLGSEYGRYDTLKEHDSVRIDRQKNCFYWNSQGVKGSIIDFAIHLGNCNDAKEASNEIAKMYGIEYQKPTISRTDYQPQKVHVESSKKEEVKLKGVQYPPKAESMKNAWHYLVDQRKIDPSVVEYFRRRNMLYQDTHNNCVFATKDYAGMRSTGDKKFVADARGCNYDECFFFKGKATDNKPISKMFVAESVIDIMSVMSYRAMKQQQYSEDSAYLALAGTQKSDSVFHHLDKEPDIKTVYLCLDNDTSGRETTDALVSKIKENYPNVNAVITYPPKGKDWNEYLVGIVNQIEEKKEENRMSMADVQKEIGDKKESNPIQNEHNDKDKSMSKNGKGDR